MRLKGSYLSYVMIYFFAFFAMSSFSAVLSVYLTGTGKSAAETAFIVSAAGFFSLGVVPAAGMLSDRLGKVRPVAIACLLVMAGLSLLFPLTGRVGVLFLLNGMIMSFYGATMPIHERLASVCKYRYGSLRVWGTLGYAAGVQAAGVAIQSFPAWVLFATVAVSALLAATGYLGAEEPAPASPDRERTRVPFSSFLRNRQFLLFLLIAILFYACSGSNMTFAPLLLDQLGVPTAVVGTVISVSTLVEIPLILFSHKFMDRFSGKCLLLVTFGVAMAQFLVYAFARSAWPVVAAMIGLKAVASTLYMMISLKVVSNLVEPAVLTTGLSLNSVVNNLGGILMQNIGGLLADRASISAVYLVMTGLVALCAVLTLFLRVGSDRKVFA